MRIAITELQLGGQIVPLPDPIEWEVADASYADRIIRDRIMVSAKPGSFSTTAMICWSEMPGRLGS